MSSKIRSQLAELFADVLQVDIGPDTLDLHRADCISWDSVNHLRLIMELETMFGITLEDERAADLSSLSEIESVLEAQLAAR